MTAWEAVLDLARHPYDRLVRRWNWKAAVLSSVARGLLFFGMNLPAGFAAAAGALLTEMTLRAVTSGFFGAITQTFSQVQPGRAAVAVGLLYLPLLNHTAEFLAHSLRGTPRLFASMAASVGFTALSTLFHLFIMRRGVLLVNPDGRGAALSLAADLRAMPRLALAFVTWPLRAIRLGRRRRPFHARRV
jgi:hypothetical protein